MVRERDDLPLEELRAAWRDVEPPPLADGIEECDAETQAVVGWMRAALEGLEPPPVPRHLEDLARRGERRPRPFVPGALPLAAAASALIAAGLWLWTHAGGTSALPEGRADVAELNDRGSSDAVLPEEPVVAALEPDRIEMRSGPVRLVLLQPSGGR